MAWLVASTGGLEPPGRSRQKSFQGFVLHVADHLLEVQRHALADTDDLVDSTPDGCGLFPVKG